jgi:hypothetical protein
MKLVSELLLGGHCLNQVEILAQKRTRRGQAVVVVLSIISKRNGTFMNMAEYTEETLKSNLLSLSCAP